MVDKIGKVIALCVVSAMALLSLAKVHATEDPADLNENHTVERSDASGFVADGVNTAGTEYSDSDNMVELTGGSDHMEAKVFLKRYYDSASGDEELRIYFSVHDTDANANDKIEFVFDKHHNHGDTANEAEDIMVQVTRGDCGPGNCEFDLIARNALGSFVDDSALAISNAQVISDSDGEYTVANGTELAYEGGWTGEFVLTPSDLGWSYFPQAVGFYINAQSNNANGVSAAHHAGTSEASPAAYYPASATGLTSAETWANLKLRYPIDYAIILDYSGSMLDTDGLSDNRWVRAKRAADLFVATLGLFKSDMLEDQVSVSQYSWSCSDDDESGNTTGAVPGVGGSPGRLDLPDPPTGTDSFTSGNNTDPASNNCTPIKEGIEYALDNQLSIHSPDDKTDRISILLSDGLHNQPDDDVPFDPDTDFSNDEKAFTKIRTVALGPDGSVGTDLLAEIATAFNGGAAHTHEAKYNQVDNFSDLLLAYLETLQAPLTINQVAKTGPDYSPGSPDKLVFIGVWDDAGDATDLQVTNDNGAATPDAIYTNTQIGYSAAVFDHPTSGIDWQIAGATGTDPDNEFVLADLRILAQFLVEQKQYQAGDPMLLQVKLRDNGQPILGADVKVEVAVPGEGLGNYLSTVQDNCEPGRPILSKLVFDDKMPSHSAYSGGIAGLSGQQQNPLNNDPLSGRYALAAAHFERCQKQGLDRNNLPGMNLYDDGSHGDIIPGDGIYSLLFDDTTLEGSYTFRFFALGATSDGVKFSRMRLSSQYVGIEPDPVATETVVQAGPQIGGLLSKLVFFLPKDHLGNYVGPGFRHNFRVSVSGGLLQGDLMDLNNGYYLQAVRYSANGPEPTVVISSSDDEHCFELVIGDDPGSSKHKHYQQLYLWLILLLAIILVLLVLLINCWLRSRQHRAS